MGLNNSEGNVPEPGVCNDEDAVLALLSKPAAAAKLAVAAADAMVASRCLLRK